MLCSQAGFEMGASMVGALPGVAMPQGPLSGAEARRLWWHNDRANAEPFHDGEDDNQGSRYHAPRALLAGVFVSHEAGVSKASSPYIFEDRKPGKLDH